MNGQDHSLRASEVNARAAAWLRRSHFGEWAENDEAELTAWLAEAPANRLAYWRLKAGWNRMDRLAALQSVQPKSEARAPFRGYLKIAAALIVTAMLAGAGYLFIQPRETAYATAVGARKTIELTDGSRIELNTDSLVTITATAKARTVHLERGEAFFQVKHDSNRPFVVMAGDHRIIDVGTQFLVRREKGNLEVALVEGRARFDMLAARTQPHSVSLSAGDVVVANASHTELRKEPISALTDELSWRRGVLVFRHTTLAEAAAEFNRYNPEKIVVADAGAARLTLNGTFKINDVAAFTDAAHAVFGLKVDIRGGEIVITR